MFILYTTRCCTECCSTTREVITIALYCKHWIHLPRRTVTQRNYLLFYEKRPKLLTIVGSNSYEYALIRGLKKCLVSLCLEVLRSINRIFIWPRSFLFNGNKHEMNVCAFNMYREHKHKSLLNVNFISHSSIQGQKMRVHSLVSQIMKRIEVVSIAFSGLAV